MAGRNKQPIAVLEARGKKHLSKLEREKRRSEEVPIPPEYRDVQVPEYLFQWPDKVKDFDRYSSMLIDIMPENFGQLDADCLARYVVAESMFEDFTARLVNCDDVADLKNLHIAQDRAFRQAHACASALGLTVTSRCKLVVPGAGDDDGECEF